MSVLIGGLVDVLFQVDRKRIHRFLQQLRLRSHVQSVSINSDDRRVCVRAADKEEAKQAMRVERIEVETVLRSLGLFSDSEAAESMEADVISGLFDEKSPSLDEVKEAFDVFDFNKDGFIDADELQRVLRALGLRQGSGIEECTKMIGLHDENGDGVMDFDEFVKFMETVPC